MVDYSNRCIQGFTADGNFLRKFGKCGSGPGDGELNGPSGISIDSDNVVYVTDHLNY